MKRLISWAIQKIPRKHIQKFAHILAKMASIFYLGKKVKCTVCDHHYRKFLPYGRGKSSRSNALCPNCLSLERHRLMWLFLKDKTDFFQNKELKILHVAPELCFIKRFEKVHGDNYITADLESPLAKVKMDVHDIPFEDNSFDVVFCNHVLEHVDDDFKVMKEFQRVLKPGGWAILQSPIWYHLETTYEDLSITDPKERLEHFGQEDHVRIYGRDYADRLRQGGFDVVEDDLVKSLTKDEVKKFALPEEESICLCKKIA